MLIQQTHKLWQGWHDNSHRVLNRSTKFNVRSTAVAVLPALQVPKELVAMLEQLL